VRRAVAGASAYSESESISDGLSGSSNVTTGLKKENAPEAQQPGHDSPDLLDALWRVVDHAAAAIERDVAMAPTARASEGTTGNIGHNEEGSSSGESGIPTSGNNATVAIDSSDDTQSSSRSRPPRIKAPSGMHARPRASVTRLTPAITPSDTPPSSSVASPAAVSGLAASTRPPSRDTAGSGNAAGHLARDRGRPPSSESIRSNVSDAGAGAGAGAGSAVPTSATATPWVETAAIALRLLANLGIDPDVGCRALAHPHARAVGRLLDATRLGTHPALVEHAVVCLTNLAFHAHAGNGVMGTSIGLGKECRDDEDSDDGAGRRLGEDDRAETSKPPARRLIQSTGGGGHSLMTASSAASSMSSIAVGAS